MRPPAMRSPALALLLFAAVAGTTLGQGFGRRRGANPNAVPASDKQFTAQNVPYDARFTFVRLAFNPSFAGWGGGGRQGGGWFNGVDYGWDHDYPRADQHFTTIVGELTSIHTASGTNILWIGSPDIFRYPIGYVSEPGLWTQTDAEAANLSAYLRKGGFLIFDDFSGNYALQTFERELQRVIPGARLVALDNTHPIFNSFFQINLDAIPSGYGATPYYIGVFEENDPGKRLMLIANYNGDIGEAWEWSDTGIIPIDLSNEAYKLGINYLVYAMTH